MNQNCSKCKYSFNAYGYLQCSATKMAPPCKYIDECDCFNELTSKPILIGFAGKARHGKTTAALALKGYLEQGDWKVVISPCAKALKEIAKNVGWDGEKDERGRTLLQKLSDPIKAYFGDDYYAKMAVKYGIEQKADIILVDDVRMFPEVNYFNSLADGQLSKCYLFRINRPNFKSDLSENQLNDKSETQLDNYFNENEIIVNDGTIDDLTKKIINKIRERELL